MPNTRRIPNMRLRMVCILATILSFSAIVSIADTPGERQKRMPTFSEDVAPIIYKNCTQCHRSGEIAPFPLVTYNDASKYSTMIASVVGRKYMPPWKPDQSYVTHADARGLTDIEIQILQDWADAGAPEGDASKTPKPPVFTTGSQLGTPDLVLKMSEPYMHKGNNKDMYRCFVIPTGLLQNRDVAALEFRPGNAKIVHHALFYLDTTGKARKLDSADPEPGYLGFGGPGFDAASNYLGWVPGATSRFLPAGIAMKMYKNSDLVIQIHYAPNDIDQSDQSSVNVFFSKTPALRELLQFPMSLGQLPEAFTIPANQRKSFVASYQIPNQLDVSLITIAPHMHLLGRTVKSYAVTPTNDTIRFVAINDWDFRWQGGYTFKKVLKVPRGSTLYYETMYDNTTSNSQNPNTPPKLIHWGESTYDEMLLCYYFFTYYLPGDENIVLETKVQSTVPEVKSVANKLSLSCEPNPVTSNEATIRMNLPEWAQVRLAIFNEAGNWISDVYTDNVMERGTHLIRFSTTSLGSGKYFLRVLAGNTSASTSFTVIR